MGFLPKGTFSFSIRMYREFFRDEGIYIYIYKKRFPLFKYSHFSLLFQTRIFSKQKILLWKIVVSTLLFPPPSSPEVFLIERRNCLTGARPSSGEWKRRGTLLCIPLANLFVVLHVDYIEERRRIGNLVVLGKTDASRYAPSIKSERGESFLSRGTHNISPRLSECSAYAIRGESIPDSVLVRL